METGFIPPNLHFKQPRIGVKALEENRIKVVSELTPWEGGYVGINPKEKINKGLPKDDLPRLVAVSGRTELAVETLLSDVS